MKTAVAKNNNTVKNTPVTADNKKVAFVHGNPVNEVSNKKDAEEQKPKDEPTTEQPATDAAKAAQVNIEAKAEPAKHVLNLEETLKLVAELNRRKIQRDKLIETIDNLEAFEIEIKEDADETDGNIYQGCVLTIEDDSRRKFTTKNPVIIWTVAQQVNSMCVNKLSEIEAGIILPH